MSHRENKRQWEALGQLDPLWAMTGTNRFNTWDLEAFLQTGDHQVAHVMATANQLGVPQRYERVLDFGCGAGRLTRGLRAHFEHYAGLDISESLIAKAREIHAALPNSTFAVSSGAHLDMPNDSLDMVFSWGVLQHIADRGIALDLLAEFVRVLRPGGLLVFSALHHIRLMYRLQPRRRLYHFLSKIGIADTFLYHRLKLYPQQVHFIPKPLVVSHLLALGAQVLEIRHHTPHNAPHQMLDFYVTK